MNAKRIKIFTPTYINAHLVNYLRFLTLYHDNKIIVSVLNSKRPYDFFLDNFIIMTSYVTCNTILNVCCIFHHTKNH